MLTNPPCRRPDFGRPTAGPRICRPLDGEAVRDSSRIAYIIAKTPIRLLIA